MVERRPPGRIGVGEVVVGHLFSVQLLGLRQTRPRRCRRGRARPADAGSRRSAAPRCAARCRRTTAGSAGAGSPGASVEPIQRRHRDVVLGGVPECQRRQPLPLVEREAAGAHRGQHTVVAERVDDDRDAGMVLGGRPHHRRTADVDLLDALVLAGAGGDRLAERVEVDHDQVERLRSPSSSSAARCSGLRVSASRPACTFGCRVLTRPSSTSGKPVTCSTGVTGMPLVGNGFRGRPGGHDGDARVVQALRPAPPARSCRRR